MRNENCVFCKIINGDIPSAKLYEDEEFIGNDKTPLLN